MSLGVWKLCQVIMFLQGANAMKANLSSILCHLEVKFSPTLEITTMHDVTCDTKHMGSIALVGYNYSCSAKQSTIGSYITVNNLYNKIINIIDL